MAKKKASKKANQKEQESKIEEQKEPEVKTEETELVPDRLEVAIGAKFHECEIDDKKLSLRKWTLRQSLRVTRKITGIIKDVMPTGNVVDVMSVDLEHLLEKYEDDFVEILVTSVQSNFESEKLASDWVEKLDIDDSLDLFILVGQLNLRPLLTRLGVFQLLAGKLAQIGGANATAETENVTEAKAGPSLT